MPHTSLNLARRTVVPVVACALAVGCGLKTNTTGVQVLGPDTYLVAVDDLNPSTSTGTALAATKAFCGQQSKEVLVTNRSVSTQSSRVVTEITFMCLAKGDPELARPRYETAPSTVIENRTK